MKNQLIKFYYLVYMPLNACYRYLLFLVAGLFVLVTFFYAIFFNFVLEQDIFKVTPKDIKKITEWKGYDNTLIFDNNGNVISEQFSEYHVYIPYPKIPKKMIETIIAIEDRKFWQHKGIDIYGIFRAAWAFLRDHETGFKQGASTITQQVVKNLLLTKNKTITRKIREIILSLYVEKYISKEKILEIYYNSMFLGNGAYGVGAAARRYFDKSTDQLEIHEMAIIAGLFQRPGPYNPAKHPARAKKRQLVVLDAMLNAGYIDQKDSLIYKKRPLDYQQYHSKYGEIAPYFIDHVILRASEILQDYDTSIKNSGLKIYTTLDTQLQKLGEQTFSSSQDIFSKLENALIEDEVLFKKEISVLKKSEFDTIIELEPKNEEVVKKENSGIEGALLALDRRTGAIVTMIGGREYEISQFNRTTQSFRSPGSTFKTFTYALALKSGHTWNEMFYVTPITIANYRPSTASSLLYSESTMLAAFYKSINAPAILLGQKIGLKNVLTFAQQLGIKTPLKEEASTLLGGSEVTLMDMARAYSIFANKGIKVPPSAITKIVDRQGNVLYRAPPASQLSVPILEKSVNELIVEGLRQVVIRGTGYAAKNLARFVAGKTGTSNNAKDNWFCGFTDDLVVIVWLGNDQQKSFQKKISAANTATPLWARFVKKSIAHLRSRSLPKPTKIHPTKINPLYGNNDESGVEMYFLSHKMPKKINSDLLLLEKGEKLRVGIDEL